MALGIHVQPGTALSGQPHEPDMAVTRRRVQRAARLALESQAVTSADISITLLDDAEIAELNQRFLQHDGPTDVISFALYEDDEDPVGDIYIGLDQARRQAAAAAVALEEELVRLAVHGVLHVLGFEHPEGEERLGSAMWQLQEAIVADALAR